MIDAPHPAEPTGLDPPEAPAESAGRLRGPPPIFWILIAFGFACVLAGVVVGRFGARLFPVPPRHERPVVASPAPRPLGKPAAPG